LYIAHGHPDISPGGGELAAYRLYQAMRESGEYEAFFLFRSADRRALEYGCPISRYGEDDHVYQLVSLAEEHDLFHLSAIDGDLRRVAAHLRALKDFLIALQPDIVHFQHFLFIGLEAVSLVRRFAPGARIVMTLHEFLAICPSSGAMIKTGSGELCHEARPEMCAACFPERPSWQLFLRERHVRAALSMVDEFIAPSEFLRRRFIAWGLAAEKIAVMENLPPPWPQAAPRERPQSPFAAGFVGRIVFHKGLEVYLRAAAEYQRRRSSGERLPALRFAVHGAIESLPDALKRELAQLTEETATQVHFHGAYSRHQLPALLSALDCVVVPSVWWENSPMVIQEAFMAGLPVVCSDVGGMAEKVGDGVNGLHFRLGDHLDLLAKLLRLAAEAPLYAALAAGTPAACAAGARLEAVHRLYSHMLAGGESVQVTQASEE